MKPAGGKSFDPCARLKRRSPPQDEEMRQSCCVLDFFFLFPWFPCKKSNGLFLFFSLFSFRMPEDVMPHPIFPLGGGRFGMEPFPPFFLSSSGSARPMSDGQLIFEANCTTLALLSPLFGSRKEIQVKKGPNPSSFFFFPACLNCAPFLVGCT